jgi:hypothetical protein
LSVPARIVEIDDAQALEWQLVENSQRVDVHPYEEAQGFQRLLDIPGYDVPLWLRNPARAPATSTPVFPSCNSSPPWPRRLLRSASPPATPTSSPGSRTDDVAEHFADRSNQQTAEEILLSTIDALTDEKLTDFALRLVLTGYVAIPCESEFDFLIEAESAFVPSKPKKEKKTPVATSTRAKKPATKKKVAA